MDKDKNKQINQFINLYQKMEVEKLKLPTFDKDIFHGSIHQELKPHLNRQRFLIKDQDIVGIGVLDLINPTPFSNIAKLDLFIDPSVRDQELVEESLNLLLKKIPDDYSDVRFTTWEESCLEKLIDIYPMEKINQDRLFVLDIKENQDTIDHILDDLNNTYSIYHIINGEAPEVPENLIMKSLAIIEQRFELKKDELEDLDQSDLIERWNRKKYVDQNDFENDFRVIISDDDLPVGICTISNNEHLPKIAYLDDLGSLNDINSEKIETILLCKAIQLLQNRIPEIKYLVYEEGSTQLLENIQDNLGFDVWRTFTTYRWDRDDWII